MKFRKGDNVVVITGDDVGKTGVITKIFRKQDKVLVEGINKKIRHTKGRDGNPGERAEFFAPIHISNVAVVDKNGKPSRIGYKIENKDKLRVIKSTGEVLTGKIEKKKVKTGTKKKTDITSKKTIKA